MIFTKKCETHPNYKGKRKPTTRKRCDCRLVYQNVNGKWFVDIIESEAGWGQRLDEVRGFIHRTDADRFQKKFNSGNTSPVTPEWYMYATDPYPRAR